MGFEKFVPLVKAAAPEAEVLANKLFADVVPAIGKQGIAEAKQLLPVLKEQVALSADATVETASGEGIRTIIFGGYRGSVGRLKPSLYPQPGPVWTEEALFRRDHMAQISSDCLFDDLFDASAGAGKKSLDWLHSAGFEYPRFSSQLVNKQVETGHILPKSVLSRLEQAARQSDGSITPVSTHFFKDSAGQMRLMDAYTAKDAATLLNYSPRTVQDLMHTSRLPGHKIMGERGNGEWRVLLPRFEKMLGENTKVATQETEATLFQRAAKGSRVDDHFRLPFER